MLYIALTRPIADFVIALGNDGRVVSQGSLDKALKEDSALYEELRAEVDELAKADQVVDDQKPDEPKGDSDGKLVVAEEIQEGRVGWSACEFVTPSTWLPSADYDCSETVPGEHVQLLLVLLGDLYLHTGIYERSSKLLSEWRDILLN